MSFIAPGKSPAGPEVDWWGDVTPWMGGQRLNAIEIDTHFAYAVGGEGYLTGIRIAASIEITCPYDITLDCDEAAIDPSATGVPTVTGGIPPIDISYSDCFVPGSCLQDFVIVRTWTATDAVGSVATCQQTIAIVDTKPPELTCPADLYLECLDDVPAPDPSLVEAVDNCSEVTIEYVGDHVDGGTCPTVISRTYIAMDECGNCSQCVRLIVVDDVTKPLLTCAPDDTVGWNGGISFTEPDVADNCDSNPLVTVVLTDTVPGNGQVDVTYVRCWEATDFCGNVSDSCCQAVSVSEPVPVEIADFEAMPLNEGILLEWTSTAVSQATSFFVHRSANENGGRYFILTDEPVHGDGLYTRSYSYLDREVVPGTLYYYKLEAVESGQTDGHLLGPFPAVAGGLGADYWLGGNTPNPFIRGQGTTIRYSVAKAGGVRVSIFDASGRLVRSLSDRAELGLNFVFWDGTDKTGRPAPAGVYFYQLRTESFISRKRMILAD
jgi:hypothetical protein